jgi:hypothetical protein
MKNCLDTDAELAMTFTVYPAMQDKPPGLKCTRCLVEFNPRGEA